MRDLVYYVAVSLDGRIADQDGGYDAFLVDGDHASVVVDEYADALPAHAHAALGTTPPGTRFDTVLMGWRTLTPALDAGIESPYPHLRQIVASSRPREVAAGIEVSDDPLATVRALKRADGLDIWLCGGGALAASLLPEIDRLVLKRHPIVLGDGVGLFGSRRAVPPRFRLDATRPFASGVVVEEHSARGRATAG
ncbi:dihydrofolate reductase family protein [Agrococcus sp. BE272]|uniref:dihydrofolate reductase family protein n=1 Tax=Agrococcus sp. BE272 TaxID=2817727 RepID=UPI00285D60E0|nr:dihydrofolate reductase family protein [Agrococcus sp. BE272]MDR7235354.1 dihydrofolate reductase [Agrococcus sp. BE272]